MAALLTSVRDDKDKSALYLSECRRMGIKVLSPDVNESDAEYTPRGVDIRFGLAAIRNVGEGVVASIKSARTLQESLGVAIHQTLFVEGMQLLLIAPLQFVQE